ncbi:hypothetical protein [Erwinia psidii]|uniref:hypothetical protein n=1 Tax=Erwinia psidii TaxID=69224 RepID=UPI00226B9CF6|nr:hypothetical protein [Erwinia psidii]
MTNYAKLGEYTAYKKQAQDAVTAEEEMRTAVYVANQAAPLCGEQKIDLKHLMHI